MIIFPSKSFSKLFHSALWLPIHTNMSEKELKSKSIFFPYSIQYMIYSRKQCKEKERSVCLELQLQGECSLVSHFPVEAVPLLVSASPLPLFFSFPRHVPQRSTGSKMLLCGRKEEISVKKEVTLKLIIQVLCMWKKEQKCIHKYLFKTQFTSG